MLKIIWILNAVLLLVAIGIALFGSGQDAAGRGILWFFVALFAGVVAASWFANRAGSGGLSMGIGLAGCVVGAFCVTMFVRSVRSANAEASGRAFWKEPAQRQLADAISKGDTAAMRTAISAGANPNAEGIQNETPLSFAVRTRPDAVGALIKLGANPNPERADVMPPLAVALTAFDPAFEQLLEGGANPNYKNMYGTPILFTTIQAGVFTRYESLVKHGADVNALNSEGRTTLMEAISNTQWKMALDLLNRGVDRTIVGRDGVTVATMLERMRSTNGSNADYQAVERKLSER